MLKPLLGFVIAVALAIGTVPSAKAVGDGGGGCDFYRSAIGQAMNSGSVTDFQRAINDWLEYQEQQYYKKSGFFSSSPAEPRPEWRREQLRLLLVGKSPRFSCAPSMLPAAIGAGSIDIAGFLLARPFGIDLPTSIATVNICWGRRLKLNDEQRLRRSKAFAMVLDTTAIDVNAPVNSGGMTVLQVCTETDLLEMFVERGARVDKESDLWSVNVSFGSKLNLLELAIAEALFFDETSSTAMELNGVERAIFFAKILPPTIKGRPIESYVRNFCNRPNSPQVNPKTCRTLATFIKSTPGTFGDGER